MPQQPVPLYWKEQVYSEVAQMEGQGQRVSNAAIKRKLERHAEDLWKDRRLENQELADMVPSERSIGRIRKDEWLSKTESQKAEYRAFYWPESMERGDLPWEAGAAALELLGHLGVRPSIRLAKWFWRVTLATPDVDANMRRYVAGRLAFWERLGQRPADELRGFEWYLAYSPWRSGEQMGRYQRARIGTKTGIYADYGMEPVPIFPPASFIMNAGTSQEDLDALTDAMWEIVGNRLPTRATAEIRERWLKDNPKPSGEPETPEKEEGEQDG